MNMGSVAILDTRIWTILFIILTLTTSLRLATQGIFLVTNTSTIFHYQKQSKTFIPKQRIQIPHPCKILPHPPRHCLQCTSIDPMSWSSQLFLNNTLAKQCSGPTQKTQCHGHCHHRTSTQPHLQHQTWAFLLSSQHPLYSIFSSLLKTFCCPTAPLVVQ